VHRIVAISVNYHPSGLTAEARRAANEKKSGIESWLSRWWTSAGAHLAKLEKRVKIM
jgi:hypothetical protein